MLGRKCHSFLLYRMRHAFCISTFVFSSQADAYSIKFNSTAQAHTFTELQCSRHISDKKGHCSGRRQFSIILYAFMPCCVSTCSTDLMTHGIGVPYLVYSLAIKPQLPSEGKILAKNSCEASYTNHTSTQFFHLTSTPRRPPKILHDFYPPRTYDHNCSSQKRLDP